MQKTLRRRWPFFIVLLVFISLVVLTEGLLHFYKEEQMFLLREKVTAEANKVKTALTSEINSSLNLVLGMVGYLNIVDEITDEDFQKIAKVIVRESGIIRNIALAPANVISYIYPLKGNENALGLDYMKNEEQKDAVLRAINSGSTIIAGPVNLVQGGIGFIARVPIYKGAGKSDYWGIASIVVDSIKLYDKSRILHRWHWIEYALKGKDSKGVDGEQFFGKKSIFEKSPVTVRVELSEGSWILAAAPKHGWNNVKPGNILLYRLIGYSIALILSFLLLNQFASHRKLALYAHIDSLTGIANRRSFHFVSEKIMLREKREKGDLYFIYFDLDGFKSVNDNYGHKTGDAVLAETARRIQRSTRKSAIFARMGGDEFIFVPLSIEERKGVVMLSEKIISEVCKPFIHEGREINIGCSIGISVYPHDGESVDQLVKCADQAMYSSKNKHTNSITFYNEIETVYFHG